jgi:hypothetical protein
MSWAFSKECVCNFSGESFSEMTTSPIRIWEDNIKMNLRDIGCEAGVDGTGSGYCPMAGFGISRIEH